MRRTADGAFTLIELLVVIAIIAVLAGIALPVFTSVQIAAKRAKSVSNMRQLGAMLVAYAGDQNGSLPTQGDSSPTWNGAAAATSAETTAWYNALPNEVGSRPLSSFQTSTAVFYTKASIFYVPAAKYPSNKLTAPLFAVAFNSKLYGSFTGTSGTYTVSAIRMQNIVDPAQLCIFQESGLPGETPIYSNQSSYNGQSASFASRSITRYNGTTIILFADGHADVLPGNKVVDSATGKAFFPQSLGGVNWTLDPTLNPNS